MSDVVRVYREQAGRLVAAVAGLTAAQLDAIPVPGTWSIRQIAIHLADCEQVFAHRIKRCIADTEARLPSFDENLWMGGLGINGRDAVRAALLVQSTRMEIVEILATVGVSALSKSGEHPDLGHQTVQMILERASKHFDHHMEHLTRKRGMVDGRA